MNIKLTPEQEIAVKSVKDFLASDREIFTLAGVSGSGKTSCIKEALVGVSGVVGATISHSAKEVLNDAFKHSTVNIDCYTIAQLLRLVREEKQDGTLDFVFDNRKFYHDSLPIERYNVILIDECSMIDLKLFDWLVQLKKPEAKIIFLGDPYQLKPIDGTKKSITFDYIEAQLLTPVRYSGPLSELATRIKSEIDKVTDGETASKYLLNEWMGELGNDERTSWVNSDGSGYIFLNDLEQMITIAGNIFRKAEHPDDLRLLAYRNSIIDKLNYVTRESIYYDEDLLVTDEYGDEVLDLPQFMPNELVICNGGYAVKYPGNNYPTKVINNNEIFRVRENMPIEGPEEISCLALKLDPMPELQAGGEIIVINWRDRIDYQQRLNKLKEAAIETKVWKKYHAFREQFAWFDYNYAQNAHKAQGRTYQDVIVIENDILSVTKLGLEEKLQALYVNCTRAKRRVFIYNAKYRVNHSLLTDKLKEELGI